MSRIAGLRKGEAYPRTPPSSGTSFVEEGPSPFTPTFQTTNGDGNVGAGGVALGIVHRLGRVLDIQVFFFFGAGAGGTGYMLVPIPAPYTLADIDPDGMLSFSGLQSELALGGTDDGNYLFTKILGNLPTVLQFVFNVDSNPPFTEGHQLGMNYSLPLKSTVP